MLVAPADPLGPVPKAAEDPEEAEALPAAAALDDALPIALDEPAADPADEPALADEEDDAEDPDEPDDDPEELPLPKLIDEVDDELEDEELAGSPGSPGRPEPMTTISVGISCAVTSKPLPSSLYTYVRTTPSGESRL